MYAWLTPETIPDTRRCWVLFLPEDEVIEAAARGALEMLANAGNWEKFGNVEPADIAEAFVGITQAFGASRGRCVMIGQIVLQAFDTIEDGWLECNGQSVLIDDYPDLFDTIGTTFGGDGVVSFHVPNLVAKFPLGAGLFFAVGDEGGHEQVTLTEGQLPPHGHSTHGHGSSIVSGELPVPGAGVELPGIGASGLTGGGMPINIRNPYLVLRYVIRAQ